MTTASDALLTQIVPRLAGVRGIAGIALGGSRARGTATATSDYDIGLYYGPDETLDTGQLLDAVRGLVDDPGSAEVTPVGEWGPRIVGGGWLKISGQKVDILYRGIEPVRAVIAACRAGKVTMDYQPGHPHGFCSAIWMGEVAICRTLHDPRGLIASLKAETLPYPDALQNALLRMFSWEVLFSIENGEIAIARGERTHIAGCIYRTLCCMGQVLFALNRRYLINEKGALEEAAHFPVTIPSLAKRVDHVWVAFGNSEFASAFSILRALNAELRSLATH
jgi:hypothetical protein